MEAESSTFAPSTMFADPKPSQKRRAAPYAIVAIVTAALVTLGCVYWNKKGSDDDKAIVVCSHNVVLCALRGGRIKGVRRISLQNHIF